MHYLKIAADKIFGRNNFINTIIWQHRATRENRNIFSNNHEYILVYAKNVNKFRHSRNKITSKNDIISRYKNPDDDSLDNIEIRPSISVRSHNWRFELKLAANLAYPDNGRPIGIFIRVSRRMFLYMLAMPNLSFYNEVISYLNSIIPLNNNIRRCLANVQNLRNNCPNLPIWQTNF
ncbi:hypothetical protein ES705_46778 [subsurface metagenome]